MSKEAAAHLQISWTIIVNPMAGKGLTAQRWPVCYAALQALLPQHKVLFTSHQNHATNLAKQAIENGSRGILTVGGDGTHNEVVNGIMQQKQVDSFEIIYALLPIGTGNDWIKTHQIQANFSAWLKMFKVGHLRTQNLGLLHYFKDGQPQQRYFANVAGLAYDGFVAQYITGKQSFLPAKIYYLLLILSCIFKYRPQQAKLFFDKKTVLQRFYTINIGICRYSGGGMQLVPHADPSATTFALTYAGNLSKLGVIFNTFRFYNGGIGNHPKVETVQAKSIQIAADNDGPLLLEADGELLGQTPVEIDLIPKALHFIAPPF